MAGHLALPGQPSAGNSGARPAGLKAFGMTTGSQLIAITLHRIPHKQVCGVVVLVQQDDASWLGNCSKCGGEFKMERDPKFETQVRAMRN